MAKTNEQNKKPAPPRHIAIIMDGNGRWAKKRGLPRTAGHAAGAETFRTIANYCRTLGVEYLTVYAFSTENWKRSEEEISTLMKLLGKYLEEALQDMEKNKVCFRFFSHGHIVGTTVAHFHDRKTFAMPVKHFSLSFFKYGSR